METCLCSEVAMNLKNLFILPMRNGNIFLSIPHSSNAFPFYPTYEEWKRPAMNGRSKASHTFYPTYEEWKLIAVLPSSLGKFSFYPTYEEWKQI